MRCSAILEVSDRLRNRNLRRRTSFSAAQNNTSFVVNFTRACYHSYRVVTGVKTRYDLRSGIYAKTSTTTSICNASQVDIY